jgi:hypothetical protein
MPPEFSIRSDSVDVDEIMAQIRARIREKRGVDYTEDELRQLASVKLEKFLDPTRVRSDLVQHYQKARQSGGASMLVPPPENFAFDDHLVYGSARGGSGRLISGIRKLLNPLLKLFINPNPIIYVLHRQSLINTHNEEQFVRVERVAALNYEVLHNLVVELTRLSIEVKNLKMRVESVSGRLDFSDRRARALESVVQYKPGAGPAAEPAEPAPPAQGGGQAARREGGHAAGGGPIKGEAQRARRRRRRRGRGVLGGPQAPGTSAESEPGGAADTSAGGADATDARGGGADSLPFDGAEPGPSRAPAPDAGEPTDQ